MPERVKLMYPSTQTHHLYLYFPAEKVGPRGKTVKDILMASSEDNANPPNLNTTDHSDVEMKSDTKKPPVKGRKKQDIASLSASL